MRLATCVLGEGELPGAPDPAAAAGFIERSSQVYHMLSCPMPACVSCERSRFPPMGQLGQGVAAVYTGDGGGMN